VEDVFDESEEEAASKEENFQSMLTNDESTPNEMQSIPQEASSSDLMTRIGSQFKTYIRNTRETISKRFANTSAVDGDDNSQSSQNPQNLESNKMQPFTSTPVRAARNFLNKFSPEKLERNPTAENIPQEVRRSERLASIPRPNYHENRPYVKKL